MSSSIHQPNDKLFKLSMGNLRVATEFFQAHLPAALLEKMDFSTLKLEKDSFVDDIYKATEADIVYSVQVDQNTAYIYILCEQQTEIARNMAFRLWGYIIQLMQKHLQQSLDPDCPLPLVYPLVVYSGTKPWDAPREIFPLFGEHEGLAREWLLQPYQLVDIWRTSDDILKQHDYSGLMQFALKYRQAIDFAAFLETLLPWIRRLAEQKETHEGHFLGRIVLQYVLDAVKTNDIDMFVQKINHHLTGELRGEIMTLAQQFEQRGVQRGIVQGVQQGIAQGVQQGIAQGVQRGEANLILRQIQRKFGVVPPAYRQQITEANAQTLLLWGDKVLDAVTLDDIFSAS